MTALSSPYSPEDVGRFYARGFWQTNTAFDLLEQCVACDPNAVYIIDGNTRVTRTQALSKALTLAAQLRNLEVESGDRVAVQCPNWHEFAVLYLAVTRLNAVMVPILPIHRHHEVAHIVDQAQATVLVVPGVFKGFDHREMAISISDERPFVRAVITLRDDRDPIGEIHHDTLLAEGAPADSELGDRPSPDTPNLMIFTSGTESAAKACVHSWNTFSFSLRGFGAELDVGSHDVQLVPSPVTHTTGLIGILLPLLAGGRTCLMEQWNAEHALQLIAAERCTHTMAATVFASDLLHAFKPDRHDVSSFRYFLCGGAPVPEALVREFRTTLGGPRILTMYGQSEFVNGSTCRPDDADELIARSDGRPLDGVGLRIVDSTEEDLPPGSEGEIWYRGPGGIYGYWNNHAANESLFRNGGWRRTGDTGRLDDDGYLRVTGRVKEIIIRGGLNISSREVEDLVVQHPKVREAGVIGIPDPRLGERVGVAIVPDDDTLTRDDLLQFLLSERQIAKPKLPEVVIFVSELPRTATGKIQRTRLLAQIIDAVGSNPSQTANS